MSEPKYREFYGFTKNGERIHLGNAKLADDDVQKFLDIAANTYQNDASGYFCVRSAVFDFRSFAGVQILPPIQSS